MAFGGMAPTTKMPDRTMEFLKGKSWDTKTIEVGGERIHTMTKHSKELFLNRRLAISYWRICLFLLAFPAPWCGSDTP